MLSRILVIALFTLAALCQIHAVQPRSPTLDPQVGLSNGERMKRGLPPKPPSRRYNPSRPRALSPRSSDTSSQVYMQTYSPDRRRGDPSGNYVAIAPGGGTLQLVDDIADAQVFTIPNSGPSTDNNVLVSYGGFTQYLVAAPGFGGQGMGTENGNTVVNIEPYATNDGGDPLSQPLQSSVWTIPSVPGDANIVFYNDASYGSPSSYVPNWYVDYRGWLYSAASSADVMSDLSEQGVTPANQYVSRVFLKWVLVEG